MSGEFFIVDLRPDWRRDPYVTLWRHNSAGYAYPLPWAGRYSKADIDAEAGYFCHSYAGRYDRFPVPCEAVEALATSKPAAHLIDGDVGPVVPNDRMTRFYLRRARYLPPLAPRARRRLVPQGGTLRDALAEHDARDNGSDAKRGDALAAPSGGSQSGTRASAGIAQPIPQPDPNR